MYMHDPATVTESLFLSVKKDRRVRFELAPFASKKLSKSIICECMDRGLAVPIRFSYLTGIRS